MKKILDFRIVENRHFNENYSLLVITPADYSTLPRMRPGQFVQVAIPGCGITLRRPISICDVDAEENRLSLLVRKAGKGTTHLIGMKKGAIINIVLPLGNGFSIDGIDSGRRIFLIGGGVGAAPLLYLSKALRKKGITPTTLIGARTPADLLMIDEFSRYSDVRTSVESQDAPDHCGLVTQHPILSESFDMIYCCGPAPMMKAVAGIAKERGIECEVSLENMMACGLGACLCCVEKTVRGNVCVCTEGPVFNINQLTW